MILNFNTNKGNKASEEKNILEMSHNEAHNFFLKKESYFNSSLPEYIDIENIIKKAQYLLPRDKELCDLVKDGKVSIIKDLDRVNCIIAYSKDGAYAWRPLSLIHPLLYIDLINLITEESKWEDLKKRFKKFQSDKRIECMSIPLESPNKKKDSATNIKNWWKNVEQSQIKFGLSYEYCMHTDITDCYSSIYTHTIAWAVHDKSVAKDDRNNQDMLGNAIDIKIRRMQQGQTNGIPQGSVLMDFISEIVLGYSDLLLAEELDSDEFNDIKIIRYRDDYRIFSNKKETAEKTLKILSEILASLNLKLNSQKTFLSHDIIKDSIKPDKKYWDIISSSIVSKNENKTIYNISIQKHLFQIKILGSKYPNSGSLRKALSILYSERIEPLDKEPDDIFQLISIVVDIMKNNPNCLEICVAILGKLFYFFSEEKFGLNKLVNKILLKFRDKPNTDFVKIWLQRLSLVDIDTRESSNNSFDSIICKKVSVPNENEIWNSDWLKENVDFDENELINEEIIKGIDLIIPKNYIDPFIY